MKSLSLLTLLLTSVNLMAGDNEQEVCHNLERTNALPTVVPGFGYDYQQITTSSLRLYTLVNKASEEIVAKRYTSCFEPLDLLNGNCFGEKGFGKYGWYAFDSTTDSSYETIESFPYGGRKLNYTPERVNPNYYVAVVAWDGISKGIFDDEHVRCDAINIVSHEAPRAFSGHATGGGEITFSSYGSISNYSYNKDLRNPNATNKWQFTFYLRNLFNNTSLQITSNSSSNYISSTARPEYNGLYTVEVSVFDGKFTSSKVDLGTVQYSGGRNPEEIIEF